MCSAKREIKAETEKDCVNKGSVEKANWRENVLRNELMVADGETFHPSSSRLQPCGPLEVIQIKTSVQLKNTRFKGGDSHVQHNWKIVASEQWSSG